MGFWRHSTGTRSLTHSLTHSILINLFIKVRLNTLLLPPLISITFVPSAVYAYSRLLITRTFKGNRKRFELSGVRVIESSKKIAENMVKDSFYCTVNILITFNCRNVKWKLKDTLYYKTERDVTKRSLNRACDLLFWEEKVLHVSLWQHKLYYQIKVNLIYNIIY